MTSQQTVDDIQHLPRRLTSLENIEVPTLFDFSALPPLLTTLVMFHSGDGEILPQCYRIDWPLPYLTTLYFSYRGLDASYLPSTLTSIYVGVINFEKLSLLPATLTSLGHESCSGTMTEDCLKLLPKGLKIWRIFSVTKEFDFNYRAFAHIPRSLDDVQFSGNWSLEIFVLADTCEPLCSSEGDRRSGSCCKATFALAPLPPQSQSGH